MRRHFVIIASVATALSSAALSGASAQLNELRAGARVRIRAPGAVAGRVDGVVIARTPDSITITMPQTAPLQIPLGSITSAEVSRGKSHWSGMMKGLTWGSAIGVAFGLLGQIGYHDCSGSCRDSVSREDMFTASVLAGAMIGGGVGAAVGSERWEALTLPVHVALHPGRRTRLAVSIPF